MLQIPTTVISESLAALQQSGTKGCEGIVLWLGRRSGEAVEVVEAYHPIHEARVDMFHIPPEGMRALRQKLRDSRVFVAAQVHSHPGQAFHSEADDRWAIVRHFGALSLVIPSFAQDTTSHSFLDDAKVYRLSEDNQWLEIPGMEVKRTWFLT